MFLAGVHGHAGHLLHQLNQHPGGSQRLGGGANVCHRLRRWGHGCYAWEMGEVMYALLHAMACHGVLPLNSRLLDGMECACHAMPCL